MKKILAKIWFFIFGWKMIAEPEIIEKSRKSVMIAAPHTSNWDFPHALFGFWIMGLDLKYFIKDKYTTGIWGGIFKWTGALGVDRSKRNNLVEHSLNLIKENENLVILVPAEGTRTKVKRWRKGFYQIAVTAGVPISFGYLDYKNKIAGVGDVYYPSGDFETDMQVIQDFYAKITPKHPELYNKQIF